MTLTREDVLKFLNRKPQPFDGMMALAKLIIRAYPFRHLSAVVSGYKRIGKSVYALLVMEDVFKAFGFSENEAWDLAKKCLCYKLEEFIDSLSTIVSLDNELGTPIQFPVIMVDDAGVGFSYLKRFTPEATELKEIFDTIGDVVTGVIYTTPNPGGLLNFIRADVTYRIEILPDLKGNPDYRVARAVRQKINIQTLAPEFTESGAPLDRFCVILPDWKYQEYRAIRRGYSRGAILKAKQRIDLMRAEPITSESEMMCARCGELRKVLYPYLGKLYCEECIEYFKAKVGLIKSIRTRSGESEDQKD
jgi:hypothetical protein